jgi:hypothetical protein
VKCERIRKGDHSVYGFVIAFALSAGETAHGRNIRDKGPEQGGDGVDERQCLNDPH